MDGGAQQETERVDQDVAPLAIGRAAADPVAWRNRPVKADR